MHIHYISTQVSWKKDQPGGSIGNWVIAFNMWCPVSFCLEVSDQTISFSLFRAINTLWFRLYYLIGHYFE